MELVLFLLLPSPGDKKCPGLACLSLEKDEWRRTTPNQPAHRSNATPAENNTYLVYLKKIIKQFASKFEVVCYAACLLKQLTDPVTNGQCLWKVIGSYLHDLCAATGAIDYSAPLEAPAFLGPLSLDRLCALLRLKFFFFCLSLKCWCYPRFCL